MSAVLCMLYLCVSVINQTLTLLKSCAQVGIEPSTFNVDLCSDALYSATCNPNQSPTKGHFGFAHLL